MLHANTIISRYTSLGTEMLVTPEEMKKEAMLRLWELATEEQKKAVNQSIIEDVKTLIYDYTDKQMHSIVQWARDEMSGLHK